MGYAPPRPRHTKTPNPARVAAERDGPASNPKLAQRVSFNLMRRRTKDRAQRIAETGGQTL